MAIEPLTPRVRVVREHHLVQEVALRGPLTIGRLPDNDIVIEDDLVSGHHARIEPAGGTWRYVDLGSTNGSVVAAGPTLRGGESFDLLEDCQVLLGATVLDIRLEAGSTMLLKRDDAEGANGEPDPQVALPPTHPRLLVVQGGRARTVAISAPRVTLGRGARSDVHIEDPSVSARHAELRWDGSQWLLRDLASTNGTRVGLTKVTRAQPVASDEHIILGAVDLLFVEDEPPEPDPRATLEALVEDGTLTRAQARQVQQERAAGQGRLGEILVRNGWLSPGQWREASSDSSIGSRPRPARWLPALAALLAATALLAWWLTRQAGA